jgi:hypothetical protein
MLRFAIAMACIAAVVVGGTSVSISALRTDTDLRATNLKTLQLIQCRDGKAPSFEGGSRRCDISRLENDVTFEPADYVLEQESKAFVWMTMKFPELWINRIEVSPWTGIQKPMTVEAITGAKWRVYREQASYGPKLVDIVVGYLEEANWLADRTPANAKKDAWLKEETHRIRMAVEKGVEIEAWRINSRLDGWAILDSTTGVPRVWNGELPGRFPGNPDGGSRIHTTNGRLYLVRRDQIGNLLAVGVGPIADIWSIVAAIIGTLIIITPVAYWMCRTGFRRQFVMAGRRPVTIVEALRSGENSKIEFKRNVGDREGLLRAVTAFANSNDGNIFVGIGDNHRVEGLNVPSFEERDRFVTSIQNAIRDRIRPNPFIDIAFEKIEGKTVARIFVPRGDQPLYCCDGRPYVREGPQSIAADGSKVARIVMEFA